MMYYMDLCEYRELLNHIGPELGILRFNIYLYICIVSPSVGSARLAEAPPKNIVPDKLVPLPPQSPLSTTTGLLIT